MLCIDLVGRWIRHLAEQGDHVLVHNTLVNNQGGDGAAIWLSGDAALTNTIIAVIPWG